MKKNKVMIILMMLLLLCFSMIALAKQNNHIRIEIKVTGLENAIMRVQNNETKIHLEQVLNKIQERHRERLSELGDLEITEDEDVVEGYIAEGQVDARLFGIFKYKKNLRYKINKEGEIKYQRRWHDALSKFTKPI